jgi:mRNA-degrading endonuclease RelE of RelBE toxin-antitoxin system
MPSDYTLFMHGAVVSQYRSLRRTERERLEKFFDFLEGYPYLEGETTERDEVGRTIEIKFIPGFRVAYWTNHADKEVKILKLERLPRR